MISAARDERNRKVNGWRKGLVAAAVLALAVASCDAPQVFLPPNSGVQWTRMTSISTLNCFYPDIRQDSLVFTALAQNIGKPGIYWDRLAFAGADGANAFVGAYPGAAEWTDYRPRWVRSGIIVYQSNRSDSVFEIFYRNVDTFKDRKLFASSVNATAPAPRPGLPGLAYVEYDFNPRPGSNDLAGRLVLIPDTAAVPLERIYLTPETMRCGEPDWDPTGQTLVFSVQDATDLSRHIYSMTLAPGDSLPVQLTVGPQHDFSPRWSPDGNRIVFSSDRGGRSGLWVVHPSGEAMGLQLVAFEDRGAAVYTPTWDPDGLSIVASSNGRGGYRSLWRLTNLPEFGF